MSDDKTYSVTADELRQFIEQFEGCMAEVAEARDRGAAVMAEAKARGYDTRIMRKIVARRKRNRDEIAEEDAIFETYLQALGMA